MMMKDIFSFILPDSDDDSDDDSFGDGPTAFVFSGLCAQSKSNRKNQIAPSVAEQQRPEQIQSEASSSLQTSERAPGSYDT